MLFIVKVDVYSNKPEAKTAVFNHINKFFDDLNSRGVEESPRYDCISIPLEAKVISFKEVE
jgi:hypothetical protein